MNFLLLQVMVVLLVTCSSGCALPDADYHYWVSKGDCSAPDGSKVYAENHITICQGEQVM